MEEKTVYELMVILKPLLPQNVRVGVESKIVEFLESGEGRLLKTDVWGKKHLAYRIQGFSEGYYLIYDFESFPSQVKSIEKSLKANKDIIRFLLINKRRD